MRGREESLGRSGAMVGGWVGGWEGDVGSW